MRSTLKFKVDLFYLYQPTETRFGGIFLSKIAIYCLTNVYKIWYNRMIKFFNVNIGYIIGLIIKINKNKLFHMNKEIKNGNESLDLKMFVDRLVEEKKLPSTLDREVIDQIKSDILSQAENRINALIINNLTSEKLKEFNDLLDKDIPDEEMHKFCSDNIPLLDEKIASELIVFRQTYLS